MESNQAKIRADDLEEGKSMDYSDCNDGEPNETDAEQILANSEPSIFNMPE